jgi:hypothetical protein
VVISSVLLLALFFFSPAVPVRVGVFVDLVLVAGTNSMILQADTTPFDSWHK